MAADSIPNKELDQWIENLSNCKQLEEVEVKRLTDKVSLWHHCVCVWVPVLQVGVFKTLNSTLMLPSPHCCSL